jgi:serine/threonine-protein kinase HipA
MSAGKILTVQWGGETVGHIAPQRKGRVTFSYAPEWLAKYNQPVSLSLPCFEERFDAQRSTAFFDNLLPEENMYRELCREARIDEADTYNFLRLYGQECAGALVITPEGEETPSLAPAYRDITDDLEAILAKHHGTPQGSLIVETRARLSIAGAQNKLPVVFESGRFLVPEDGSHAPTTAILKPTTARFPDLHRNELFCMELAREAGLQTPDAKILQIGSHQAYIVMRYDRQKIEDGIVRIHQEDFCQALGISRVYKYEENGGPGFAACGKALLHPLVSGGGAAREDFIKAALFNYALGNCDAHGKNFSLLYQWRQGVSLAPFYDLVSTMAYPELEQKFAMAIGKTFRFDRIADHSWKQFAADMNIRSERLYSLMEELVSSAAPAVEPLAARHEQQYGAAPIYETLVRIAKEGLNRLLRIAESGGRS